MKFRINANQFNKAVTPAADIALKNVFKNEKNEAFFCAYMLTIEASSTALQIRAYSGLASITVTISKSDGYVCEEAGVITV